ncbi:MAG: hypothetical protein LBD16_07050 [Oscillospiraceae bacterium]|jgi:hypothetical protein|nr:hypothetical protein [Oscillospiraceae bacterium]
MPKPFRLISQAKTARDMKDAALEIQAEHSAQAVLQTGYAPGFVSRPAAEAQTDAHMKAVQQAKAYADYPPPQRVNPVENIQRVGWNKDLTPIEQQRLVNAHQAAAQPQSAPKSAIPNPTLPYAVPILTNNSVRHANLDKINRRHDDALKSVVFKAAPRPARGEGKTNNTPA